MKEGDWIKINYVGRAKATGEVFDLTRESDARKHGVFDEKKKYGPVLTILGGGMVIRGVERELLKMRVGEKREFDVGPGDALGPRRPELIKVVSMAKFNEQKITPFPGLVLNIDGRNAKVRSVAGGRVMMDYNHPLAGKELHYEVEIVERIREPVRMAESLLMYYGLEGKVEVAAKKASIKLDKPANPFIKRLVEETLKKWCPGVESAAIGEKHDKQPPRKGEADKRPRGKA
ncbi:MAG: peptidylprolyl isomerase [Candidatus Aenigmarchaeota archaeon]|nr:peptidylprolyl isomerase [Candidatus Aenigmarchaeota archaeon]